MNKQFLISYYCNGKFIIHRHDYNTPTVSAKICLEGVFYRLTAVNLRSNDAYHVDIEKIGQWE